MNKKHKIKRIEIVLGIMFIILGILSLNRPLLTLNTLVLWFGITSIVRGIANIIGTGVFYSDSSRGFRIFIGAIDIIIGLIFVTNMVKGAFWLGAFFAFWFLVESFGNLFLTTRFSERQGIAKLGILLLDVICFLIAVILILNPIIVTLTIPTLIGVFAILYGIVQLFQGIRLF